MKTLFKYTGANTRLAATAKEENLCYRPQMLTAFRLVKAKWSAKSIQPKTFHPKDVM